MISGTIAAAGSEIGTMRKAFWRGLAVSLCTTALVAVGAPSRADAAGKTITVWWNQGFYPAEDQALKDLVGELGEADRQQGGAHLLQRLRPAGEDHRRA